MQCSHYPCTIVFHLSSKLTQDSLRDTHSKKKSHITTPFVFISITLGFRPTLRRYVAWFSALETFKFVFTILFIRFTSLFVISIIRFFWKNVAFCTEFFRLLDGASLFSTILIHSVSAFGRSSRDRKTIERKLYIVTVEKKKNN